MLSRDYRDILGGGLLFAIGAFAAIYAWAFYPLGTVRHMGPGMFPLGLGVLLAMIGTLVVLPALFRVGPELARPDLRAFFFISLALIGFATTIRWLGLIPAIVLVVVIASMADNKMGPITVAILAVLLSALAWFIFIFALGIPLQPFTWRWS
jgi:hypothetical protein